MFVYRRVATIFSWAVRRPFGFTQWTQTPGDSASSLGVPTLFDRAWEVVWDRLRERCAAWKRGPLVAESKRKVAAKEGGIGKFRNVSGCFDLGCLFFGSFGFEWELDFKMFIVFPLEIFLFAQVTRSQGFAAPSKGWFFSTFLQGIGACGQTSSNLTVSVCSSKIAEQINFIW